ncbi:TIGR00730 family Rossman fold protein [Streptacidiphilus sp. N1-12]|uniref:Cytokinin riboside 5'-monophosphate phosphoribohydrolase n=2 Tax=Streptacidiphilus alkalitolerans TaxID=3342712 RepID=A0ABV6VC17_9ACTN
MTGLAVTVYAGSSLGNDPRFAKETELFARDLVAAGAEIVYGGGSVGLMGVLADTVLAAGGRVTGVIPQSLVDAEVAHLSLTELKVVGSMHERKNEMARLADCFVALPGGLGTVEELFEAWAWLILGHHGKPVALLNTAGYWDPLLTAVQAMARAGFIGAEEATSLVAVDSAEELLRLVDSWTPPAPRWA